VDEDRAAIAGRYAWGRLASGRDEFPAAELRQRLSGAVEEEVLDEWLEAAVGTVREPAEDRPDAVLEAFGEEERAAEGIYTTPGPMAEGLAAAVDPGRGDRVVDLAAGTGSLLAAAARREPRSRLFGVERHPSLAVVCAARTVGIVGDSGSVRVSVGDGLAAEGPWTELEGTAEAVVGNPPYVREKGRKERFRRLRESHEHLAPYFGPRIDLSYLFVHRSLDYARDEGRLAFVTSSYWLSATGGKALRRDLLERAAPVALVRARGANWFASAPGHHTLISVFERGASRTERAPVGATAEAPVESWVDLLEELVGPRAGSAGREGGGGVVRPPEGAFREAGWSPFAGTSEHDWEEELRRRGTALEDLLLDRQGFVSGADRVTGRRLSQLEDPPEELEVGDPGFVLGAEEIPDRLESLRGTVLRPVLRGSRLDPGDIWLVPPREEYALYIDGALDGGQEWVVQHLAPLRPALEDRREVREGRMPWYRLHWPRDRSEQTSPKLVVPRRAARPRFALDLSASAISSDCTYLGVRGSTDDPIRYLIRVMVALNRPAVIRYLRHFGKRKGDMLEFYSDPLQSLPLPLRRRGGDLEWVPELLDDGELSALRHRVSRLVEAVESGELDGVGRVRPDD